MFACIINHNTVHFYKSCTQKNTNLNTEYLQRPVPWNIIQDWITEEQYIQTPKSREYLNSAWNRANGCFGTWRVLLWLKGHEVISVCWLEYLLHLFLCMVRTAEVWVVRLKGIRSRLWGTRSAASVQIWKGFHQERPRIPKPWCPLPLGYGSGG